MHMHVRPVSFTYVPSDGHQSGVLITVHVEDSSVSWETMEQIDSAIEKERDKIDDKVVLLYISVADDAETFLAISLYDRLKDVAEKLLISRSCFKHFTEMSSHGLLVLWEEVLLPPHNKSFESAMEYPIPFLKEE